MQSALYFMKNPSLFYLSNNTTDSVPTNFITTYMGIDLHRGAPGMSQKLLNVPQFYTKSHQMSRSTVPKRRDSSDLLQTQTGIFTGIFKQVSITAIFTCPDSWPIGVVILLCHDYNLGLK